MEILMEREKLKLIYKNLKSLLNVLESEIYSDTTAYNNTNQENYDDPAHYCNTDDDDGYAD
jgi:hypothetical protein